jgi:hypothetical protein
VEINAYSVLSLTAQWLFVLQGAAPGSKQQQKCHGYWFMLGLEAEAMKMEMQGVIDSLLLEQVRSAVHCGSVAAAYVPLRCSLCRLTLKFVSPWFSIIVLFIFKPSSARDCRRRP